MLLISFLLLTILMMTTTSARRTHRRLGRPFSPYCELVSVDIDECKPLLKARNKDIPGLTLCCFSHNYIQINDWGRHRNQGNVWMRSWLIELSNSIPYSWRYCWFFWRTPEDVWCLAAKTLASHPWFHIYSCYIVYAVNVSLCINK